MKKNTTKSPLAWSSAFWIQLQKGFVKPNIRDGLLETDYLFRAILKKSSNRVRLTNNGNAYWDNIGLAELTKWRLTMTLWGWGAKKVIVWHEALDKEFLRASIRFFALHPDGPLPVVMCKGAQSRKEWLLKKIESKRDVSVWTKIRLQDASDSERYQYLHALQLEERNKLGHDAKEFYFAYTELLWKKTTSARVYRWLLRTGFIPLAGTTEWMQIWAWEQEEPSLNN